MEKYKNFYVFTGSRGGQKNFAIGNIQVVRNTLKKAGILVVNDATKADAVIIPDGAISKIGLPIFTWNDFVQFRRREKITKPLSLANKMTSHSDNVFEYPLLNSEHKRLSDPFFDFSILQASLEMTNIDSLKHKTQNDITILETPNAVDNPQLFTYTTKNTIDIGFGIKCMEKLVHVTTYFLQPVEYISDLYSAVRIFYQQLDQLFKIILVFWGELRGNLSLQYDLPPPKKLDFDDNLIQSTWLHFQQNFNPLAISELCQFFTVPLSPSSMKYFEAIEHDLIYMQSSLVYKNEALNQEFEIWSKETRKKFRRCEHLSESDCTHCCMFDKHSVDNNVNTLSENGLCKDKPFLVALDDIIKSLCGKNSEHDDQYVDDLQFLQTSLIEIFINLFGIHPSNPTESICAQIIYMFDTIKLSLESMIGKSIRWSQIADFMQISSKTWNNLWLGTDEEKESALILLSQMKEDPSFVQATKSLVIALSQIELQS
jgi:hypothetical protein